jgi:hypothetical protein
MTTEPPAAQLEPAAGDAQAAPPIVLQQLFSRQSLVLMEDESMERLSIVQNHHRKYALIADHFLTLLQLCAEDSNYLFEHLTHPTPDPDGGQRRAASVPTTSLSPTRSKSHLLWSPMDAATARQELLRETIHVEMDASQHFKRQNILERRLALHLAEERRIGEEHSVKEHKRAIVSVRRELELSRRQRRIAESFEKKVDRQKLWLEQAARERVQREKLEEKMERMDSRKRELENTRAAVQKALQTMDTSASRAVEVARASFVAQQQRQSKEILRRAQSNRIYGEKSVQQVRRRAKESLLLGELQEREYTSRMAYLANLAELHEHEDKALKALHKQPDANVQVMWPSIAAMAEHSTTTASIDQTLYARLCGYPLVLPKVTPAHVDALSKLSPQHWSMLRDTQATGPWEAADYARYHAAVRGPRTVVWK